MREHIPDHLKVLSVHSYAVQRTASMKVMSSVLGSRLLPVPSLILTGLTNLSGIKRMQVEFRDLLFGTLDLARTLNQRVFFYTGYLGNPDQAASIQEALNTYSDCIELFLVDPVSGDHGRHYVPQEIIEVWPSLLAKANWAFPNYTELKLYSGIDPQSQASKADYIQAFSSRFPQLNYLATSLPNDKDLEIGVQCNGRYQSFPVRKLEKNYGGTGDIFASLFVKDYLLEQKPLEPSIVFAAEQTYKAIAFSMSRNSDELLIYPDTFL